MRLVLLLLCAAAAAAQQPVDLRYRFVPGGALSYLTTVSVTGIVAGAQGGGEAQRMPLAIDLEDQVVYRVMAVDDEGNATIELQLRSLHLGAGGLVGGEGFSLRVGDDQRVTVEIAGQTYEGDVPAEGDAPDATPLAMGITLGQLLEATRPSIITLAPTGELIEQQDPLWPERLQAVPLLGQVIGVVRGSSVLPPPLPGESMAFGGSWDQPRLVPLPGGDGTYELQMAYTLEQFETVGAFETARIALNGDGMVLEQPFSLEVMRGMELPMNMTELHQDLAGTAFFDPAAGALVELRIETEIAFHAESRMAGLDLGLDAELKVKSTTMLLKTVDGGEPPVPAEAVPAG